MLREPERILVWIRRSIANRLRGWPRWSRGSCVSAMARPCAIHRGCLRSWLDCGLQVESATKTRSTAWERPVLRRYQAPHLADRP